MMTEPRFLKSTLHFAAGCAAGAFALLVMFLLALFGLGSGPPFWVGVFITIWMAVFLLLRRRMVGVIVGFAVTLLGGYALLVLGGIIKIG